MRPCTCFTWCSRKPSTPGTSGLNDQFLALKTSIAAFKPPYDEAIVHVDLNNTSLRALKDYHPSRAHYARAIRNLGDMQAAVQMCDFIFVGETSPQNDRLLIEATQAAGNVVFGMAFRLVDRPTPAEAAAEDPESRDYLELSTWKLPGSEGASHFYFGVDPLITLAPLARVSRGTGFLTLTPDPDGVIRRIALIVRVAGGFYPSFALKSLCEFLNVPTDRVVLGAGSLTLREALRPGASTPRTSRSRWTRGAACASTSWARGAACGTTIFRTSIWPPTTRSCLNGGRRSFPAGWCCCPTSRPDRRTWVRCRSTRATR